MTFAELNKKYGVSINGGYNEQIKMVGNFATDTDALGYMQELNLIPGYSQAFGRDSEGLSPVYPPIETNAQHRHLNKGREGRIQVYVRFGVDGKRYVVFGTITKIVIRMQVKENGQWVTKDVEYSTLKDFLAYTKRMSECNRKGDYDTCPGGEYLTQFTSADGKIVELQSGVSLTTEIGSSAYRVICDGCNETILWCAEAVDANGDTESGLNVYNLTRVSFNCEACTEKADAPYNEPVDFAYHR